MSFDGVWAESSSRRSQPAGEGDPRMHMHGFRRLVLAALPLLALVLAAPPGGAQGKGTIKIASQSPLSGGQSALGEGIKLGTQLAIEQQAKALEGMGFKVALVPFDDQAKPDVGVAHAKNPIADSESLHAVRHV